VSDKLSIEEHLVLKATAPWVDTPHLLLLHHNGRRWGEGRGEPGGRWGEEGLSSVSNTTPM